MKKSQYNNQPEVRVYGYETHALRGYEAIVQHWLSALETTGKRILALECYPGVRLDEIQMALEQGVKGVQIFRSELALKSESEIYHLIQRNLTDDRVRGVMSHHELSEFFDNDKLEQLSTSIAGIRDGLVVVLGTGATLCCEPDHLVYADMARWEIQLRYRDASLANFGASNHGEDFLRMYKRGYFVDWRVADRHKRSLWKKFDTYLDTNTNNDPKLISSEAFHAALAQVSAQPFRVVPYFDPGPWGGQWMKEVCNLDPTPPNYAWSFDGVPEENSLLLRFGDVCLEMPSINLVFLRPRQLLGDKVHARFGEEFPIRFDFLDTMQGGHLSLQVHPTSGYIYEQFGMPYTQDESYYMLDAGEGACVYLGLKDDADLEQFQTELEEAQAGGKPFEAEKFVNCIPAKKHDHFLIPAGTIHCSGSNSMVLEISATPYIFTFKLWDWGRLGLDGKPRPVHLEHGLKVINAEMRTEKVHRELVNAVELISETDQVREERTGLHEREFIETRRHWFSGPVEHNTEGGVMLFNLIEGEEITLRSPTNAFEPTIFHYAETFIVPAAIGPFIVEPSGASVGQRCATIRANVRT